MFQSKILEEYDKIAVEFGLTVIDATLSIQKQQSMIREIVKEKLSDYKSTPFLKKKEKFMSRKTHAFYDAGLPYIDVHEMTGKLIVIEGTDGVGRSTK